jgi:hypothetical protein
VSLVGPRRTFAVLQASTRSRVDLGLRLPDREPGGGLLPAPAVGDRSCTVRVALTAAHTANR